MNNQLCQYWPHSDLLIMKSNLPQLLVEVNSKPKGNTSMPVDLIWLLLMGATIVHFANRFLDAFMKKDFILFAIYIWDNGQVSRYSLFQKPNNLEVCRTSYITKFSG